VELRAKVVDVEARTHSDEPRVEMESPDFHMGSLFSASLNERFEQYEQFENVLKGLDEDPPDVSDLSSNQEKIKRIAESMSGVKKLCDFVVKTKYLPLQGLAWRCDNGNHLLHIACLIGHAKAVGYLTPQRGFYPVEQKNNFGANVLHYAVIGGSPECVEIILKSLAENKRTEMLKTSWIGKKTPLHIACLLGKEEVVKVLLRFKAPCELRDLTGSTPLMWAVFSDCLDIVRILHDHNASIVADDEDGNTPLIIAILRENTEILEYILSTKNGMTSIGRQNTRNDTPLWIAMAKGNAAVLELVVKGLSKSLFKLQNDDENWVNQDLLLSFDLNAKYGTHENTLLHRAVLFFPDEKLPLVIQVLNCENTLQNVENAYRQTALFYALALGKIKAASVLAGIFGLDGINNVDKFGNSMLHFCLCAQSVDWLLAKSPQVKVRNHSGLTPFMTVCACGSHDAVSAMLAYDFDPSEKSDEGQMAFSFLDDPKTSVLCLPFFESDDFEEGMFRITAAKSQTAAPSLQQRKSLSLGLSRGSRASVKKGALTLTTIGTKKF
jgi:ankyrin repeat protein